MSTRIGNRLLSLFIVIVGCLCASLLPGAALAADAEETVEPDSYIGDISTGDVDTVDDPAEDAEAVTGEEVYTAPVSYTDVESGTCEENLTWVLENGVLTISGMGEMEDYSLIWTSSSGIIWSTTAPWYTYDSQITDIIINDGVTNIGNYAFCICSSLTSYC